jgi:hypothetical protein
VQARAVRRAAEIVGDDALAIRLGVSQERLRLWMQGLARPPESVFLQVVDIIGEHALQALRREAPATASSPDTPRDAA